MKKFWIIGICVAVLLAGCASPELETISDVYVTQPPAEKMTIHLELPEDAAEAVMEGSEGTKFSIFKNICTSEFYSREFFKGTFHRMMC